MLIRTFVVAFTVAALWWSSNSFGLGLGLGELKIDSNLAAPLKASVTLRGMSGIDLDPDQFSIRIDSDSKAKIKYRLLRMDSDSAIIELYTREAISDPLFQFRIEIKWDSSAVARSYDALVDPSAYEEYFRTVDETETSKSVATLPAPSAGQAGENPAGSQNTQQVKPAIALSDDSAPETEAITAVTEGLVGAPVTVDAAAVDVNSLSSPQRHEYGPTIDGNSIWRVARAVATDNPDLTIYQWMYAIWNNNPDAFTANSMHRLKMDEILGIPFEEQVAATSHSAAWRAYNEQMVSLQSASPVKSDAENVTAVDAVQVVPAVAEIQEADAQIPGSEIDVHQSSISGEAVVNEFSPNAMSEPETLAAEGTIIALLEESASTMEEESVVTRETNLPRTTDEATMTVDSLSTAVPENEAAVDAAPVAANLEEMPAWSRALQERYDHITQLPVIGTDGALSFVGRSVQAADRFIATRPSWATLAFGIWVTLVLMMLRQEILSRRKTAVAAALPEALEADETAKQKETDQNSVRVAGEVEHAEQPVAEPIASAAPSNAPAIIAQADTILARGDTEEAIKLMRLAVELQPGQPTLVMYLLELYHRTRSTELFSGLIDRSRHVLEALDSRDQTRLEVMHAQLCPDDAFPLDGGEFVANLEMPVCDNADGDNADGDNADTESESVSGLVAEIRVPSDLDAIDEVDTSIPDHEPEFEKHAELDRQVSAALENGDFMDLHIDDSEDETLIQTQVFFNNSGVPLREEAMLMPGIVGEFLDQDDTLNEVDVYLAYGLYENAEVLLLKGLEVYPERADFLARLLDSYYATRNVVDFVAWAKVMQDMGVAGAEYWKRVEIMGHELAPYNNLFADGKDKSLSTVVLEIPRPETADFEFSDIDEVDESAFTNIEITQDSESTLSEPGLNESSLGESTITDTQIGKYMDNNSELADLDISLNLDLDSHEPGDEGDSVFDELIGELDDLPETDESEIADDNEPLEVNLEATTDDFDRALPVNLEAAEDELQASIADEVADDDEPLEIDLDSTTDDFDPALTVNLEAAEDELQASIADEVADDDKSFEIDLDSTTDDFDPALTVNLEAAKNELQASIADQVADDDEVIDLDYGDEDSIQFTIDQDSLGGDLKSAQFPPADSDDASQELIDDPTVDTLFGVKLSSDNSRILHFPDSPSEGREIDEFESEVKMTLQAIRDQLQNMTERLFQQERTTIDLKQTIAEFKDDNMLTAKNSKKSI